MSSVWRPPGLFAFVEVPPPLFLYVFPVFSFILKWIWLWLFEPKGLCTLTLSTNSF